MTVLSDIIGEVRRRIHDAGTSPIYSDTYYTEAVNGGLARVNIDVDGSFTLSSLTTKIRYLTTLRAAITMCQTRGGEGASSDVSDQPSGSVTMVQTPNMTVQRSNTVLRGSQYWLDLSRILEEEYQRILSGMIDETAGTEVSCYTMQRQSTRLGMRIPYQEVREPSALTIAATVADTTVTILWDAWYSDSFAEYVIERATDEEMLDAETVDTFLDNHDIEFSEDLAAGTYYYRVKLVTLEGLYSESNVVEVEVD